MDDFEYVTLRERADLQASAAEWFHSKWGVPTSSYLECMEAYLRKETEYGWYLCLSRDKTVGGMGVIENDFHDRKDLSPNVCAVYTEKEYRGKGVARHLLDMTVEDMRAKGVCCFPRIRDGLRKKFEDTIGQSYEKQKIVSKAEKLYSSVSMAAKYQDLYNSILNN